MSTYVYRTNKLTDKKEREKKKDMGRLEVLYPNPALKLSEAGKNYLLISDIHIGFEERFNKEGFKITPSTDKMLHILTDLIHHEKPDRLIILGDVKSGFDRVNRNEWNNVPRFLEKISQLVEVSIIPGNHDGGITPLLPCEARLEPAELLIGDTGLLHGHTNPTVALSGVKRLIMGHLHPSYSRYGSPLSGNRVWVTMRAPRNLIFDVDGGEEGSKDLEIWVVPAFNPELGAAGLTVMRERVISPILRKIDAHVSEALVIMLDGSVIGDADSMKYAF
ncbi:MAG: metallophosphoesterase [Thaumarchaeota archaeon]|nr:metallophosphoesterase [Nitrososphaerota archaeon]MCL5318162.1 metallophosphoesterase [Nitrososphaerota archaeon]